MPWQSLGILTLTKDWVYTLPVEGELFRFTHYPVDNRNERYLKGVVCQGFFDDGLNIFDRRLLTWREEKEAMLFHFPVGLSEHFLAFKRLDENSIVWNIKAEVFLSANAQEDFANYVISRFGELMPLFSFASDKIEIKQQQYTSASNYKEIGAIGVEIIAQNDYRRAATIFNNSGLPVTVGLKNSEEGVVTAILAVIPSRGVYELVSGDDGIYTGAIYAFASSDASVEATEFWVDP